jgi:hypothetical protein
MFTPHIPQDKSQSIADQSLDFLGKHASQCALLNPLPVKTKYRLHNLSRYQHRRHFNMAITEHVACNSNNSFTNLFEPVISKELVWEGKIPLIPNLKRQEPPN